MTLIMKFAIVIGLLVGYLFATAGIASILHWLTSEDDDFFFFTAWGVGALIFLIETLYIIIKMGMWG